LLSDVTPILPFAGAGGGRGGHAHVGPQEVETYESLTAKAQACRDEIASVEGMLAKEVSDKMRGVPPSSPRHFSL
jgi:hypothetical protein